MDSIDVLVVGAGPVGLTMALELARHGLSCRIVEIAPAPTIYSKAQVVHAKAVGHAGERRAFADTRHRREVTPEIEGDRRKELDRHDFRHGQQQRVAVGL